VKRRLEGRARSGGYLLGFASTALVLGAMTLVLVLVILPRRYVLNAGLRESGISFPSQAAPFTPPVELRREPPPPPPPPPPTQEVPRGPAEIFWAEVETLLSQGRYANALYLFEEYLEAHPGDRGVLREFGITLSRAGHAERAVGVFGGILPDGQYPGTRLLLARTLRDLGRPDEASIHYASLVREKPGDLAMVLEWAQALSWGKDYDRAAEILNSALEAGPESADLRVELAQVYYWAGRLDDAAAVLAVMSEDALERTGAGRLKEDVVAALAPPEAQEEAGDQPPATALQRAAAAFAEEDYDAAAALYEEALSQSPGDADAWRAYADLLQYGLDDAEKARQALLRLESLQGGIPRSASVSPGWMCGRDATRRR
jgi:thioredoxin-like negative regulator of GroEL